MRRSLVPAIALACCACAGDVAPEASTSGDSAIASTGTDHAGAVSADPALGDRGSSDTTSLPIDRSIQPAVAGENGWNYQQSSSVDLDGDGAAERVVLTARVELYRGRPAWDDGQPWQVYVETEDGARTYLYARRLQLGTLALRVTRGSGDRRPAVLLIEHLPDRLTLYEASYAGPDSVRVAERFRRNLDPAGETASPRLP